LPSSTYCQHGPDGHCGTTNINVTGGGGDDVVYLNCGQSSLSFARGEGNDTISAAGGPNTINVSNGNDTVDLSADTGATALTTGTGDDVVLAQNGFVDTVNCGSKHTVVYADRNDKTSNCTVKFTPPPARDRVARRTTHRTSHRVARRTTRRTR
jgi:Ca2+-binding RTX toxin-like protein